MNNIGTNSLRQVGLVGYGWRWCYGTVNDIRILIYAIHPQHHATLLLRGCLRAPVWIGYTDGAGSKPVEFRMTKKKRHGVRTLLVYRFSVCLQFAIDVFF